MEQFQLKFDKRISSLEKENRWETAVNIVWEQWKSQPNDLNSLLCAGTQLWYSILIMDELKYGPILVHDTEIISDSRLQRDLIEITRYGFEYFVNEPIFNAYFGYMISTMPYFFLDYGGDYDGWRNKGIKMMRRSYVLAPDNPFCEAMHYEKDYDDVELRYFEACKKIWSKITPMQWGDSEVQQYFFRILKGDLFFEDAYSLEEERE